MYREVVSGDYCNYVGVTLQQWVRQIDQTNLLGTQQAGLALGPSQLSSQLSTQQAGPALWQSQLGACRQIGPVCKV